MEVFCSNSKLQCALLASISEADDEIITQNLKQVLKMQVHNHPLLAYEKIAEMRDQHSRRRDSKKKRDKACGDLDVYLNLFPIGYRDRAFSLNDSGKMAKLAQMIGSEQLKDPNRSFIVFSHHSSTLDFLQGALKGVLQDAIIIRISYNTYKSMFPTLKADIIAQYTDQNVVLLYNVCGDPTVDQLFDQHTHIVFFDSQFEDRQLISKWAHEGRVTILRSPK